MANVTERHSGLQFTWH